MLILQPEPSADNLVMIAGILLPSLKRSNASI